MKRAFILLPNPEPLFRKLETWRKKREFSVLRNRTFRAFSFVDFDLHNSSIKKRIHIAQSLIQFFSVYNSPEGHFHLICLDSVDKRFTRKIHNPIEYDPHLITGYQNQKVNFSLANVRWPKTLKTTQFMLCYQLKTLHAF